MAILQQAGDVAQDEGAVVAIELGDDLISIQALVVHGAWIHAVGRVGDDRQGPKPMREGLSHPGSHSCVITTHPGQLSLADYLDAATRQRPSSVQYQRQLSCDVTGRRG